MNTLWIKPAVWGALGGCVATVIVGFSYMDWHTAGSAERMAAERADAAVVAALVPVCVANARADDDPAKLAKFKTETSSYSRSDLVRTAGWATMPGVTSPDSSLIDACSERLRSTSES